MRRDSLFHRLLCAGLLCLPALLAAGMSPGLPAASAAAPAPSPAALQGPQPFVTLFCHFPDLLPLAPLAAHYERLLDSAEPGLADYWAEVSYGQISLTGSRVAGWYVLPQPAPAYQLRRLNQATLATLAEDCTAAAEQDVFFPDFVGINLVFNFWQDQAYGGRQRLARDRVNKEYGVTWLSQGVFSFHSAVAHEMGHALGLRHSPDPAARASGRTPS